MNLYICITALKIITVFPSFVYFDSPTLGRGQISLGPDILRLVKSVSENGKQEKPLCVCVCVCVCVSDWGQGKHCGGRYHGIYFER